MIDQVGIACCGCTACISICSQQCIVMRRNEEGFLYPQVLNESCVHCGLCLKVCPILQTEGWGKYDFREAWGVTTKDNNILLNSSSGGLFTALAETVLAENGCVFGAAFADDYQTVCHVMVENREKLSMLRGSKYIQSEMGNCYIAVKEQVKNDRKVLFTGTPCQIDGLRRFLGTDSDKVFFVDVICHGVPSAVLWQRYLSHIEKQNGGKVKTVNFRNKEKGWHLYGLEMSMHGTSSYYHTVHEDPYMRMYLKNFCLRESCYHCSVKKEGAKSDITIGDFWGIERIAPEIDNALGVSLALIHSNKGKQLFEQTMPLLDVQQVNYDKALSGNSAYYHSANRPVERNSFYADLKSLEWERLERKFLRKKLRTVVKSKLSSSVIGKIRRKILGLDKSKEEMSD